jgi:diguanylate cyclase (GGDEF)-like protein
LLKHKNNLKDLVETRMEEFYKKNIELKREIENHKLTEKELERLAITDPLTSLYNRRKIKELLQNEIERVKRHITLLSIIILDIDHFKSVNDTHGHNKGDEVLVDLARLLQSSVRSTDMVSRWGGEEFLIASVSSNARQTFKLAEKLRNKIEEYDFDGLDKITVSAGVAQYNKDETLVNFINRADKALYFAKSTGRNRVEQSR